MLEHGDKLGDGTLVQHCYAIEEYARSVGAAQETDGEDEEA